MYQPYLPNIGYSGYHNQHKRGSRHSKLVYDLSDKFQDLQTELTDLDVKVSELEDTVNNLVNGRSTLGKSDMFRDANNFKSLSLEKLTYLLYNIYCQRVGGKSFDGQDLPGAFEFFHDPSKDKQAVAWKAVAELVHNNIQ